MAYVPQSSNPLVTTEMLEQALYMVRLIQGPQRVQKYIVRNYSFQLVVDQTRKKLLAHHGDGTILFEIDLKTIASIDCLDASKTKEGRHRIQAKLDNGDVYDFYVENPCLFDPLPFISIVRQEIFIAKNPKAGAALDRLYSILAVLFLLGLLVITVIDWTNGGTIGTGIISLGIFIILISRCFKRN